MKQLFPAQNIDLEPDQIYKVPELNFPAGGVAVTGGERRPYVYFNMVSSVDGKAVSAAGNAEGLGSKIDFHMMGRLRLAADAILVAASTFRRDSFVPSVRPQFVAERALYFPDKAPPLGVVLSSDGNIPMDKKFFEAGPESRLVALGAKTTSQQEARISKYARIVRVPDNSLGKPDAGWLLRYLYREMGIQVLLCEGGPTLNYSLISSGYGDELFLTFAPRLVGSSDNKTILSGSGQGFELKEIPRLELISLYAEESELFFRYRLNLNKGD
ncbi:MAG TPA: RibD family protein [Chloroflexia bacterium]|nr:RibD family protein [Chloroflexia bacterium]